MTAARDPRAVFCVTCDHRAAFHRSSGTGSCMAHLCLCMKFVHPRQRATAPRVAHVWQTTCVACGQVRGPASVLCPASGAHESGKRSVAIKPQAPSIQARCDAPEEHYSR